MIGAVATYMGAVRIISEHFGGLKMAKITQTMKYEIAFEKDLYRLLDDISYAMWCVKNKTITDRDRWQDASFDYHALTGKFPKEKEVLGKNLQGTLRDKAQKEFQFINSRIVESNVRDALNIYKKEMTKFLKGESVRPKFERDGSFEISGQNIKNLVRTRPSKYTVKLSLLSKEGAKERGTTTQQQVTLKTGKGANKILDRIIDGTYKLCDSNISKQKSKYYLNLVYQFEADRLPHLSKDNVMGVDLGVVKAATLAFNHSKKRYYIDGDEIRSFRARIEARRIALQRQGKYCGDGRKGRGRKTKLKPIEKLRGKVENFKRTTNHRYAKFIVDMAIKHDCGVIQMEDLTGITDNADKFLKSWTYYDLQQKIEHKAEVAGIEVRKVNPQYTSQRCSRCGCIDENNRKNQADFKCVTCGYSTNADYNAARNIAIPGIDEIIAEQIEFQRNAATADAS
jgi:putative transposase